MFLLFLKTVRSFHVKCFTDVFGITLTIIYSKTEPFSVFLELNWSSIWCTFFHFWKSAPFFLIMVYIDVCCITPMVTALNGFLSQHSLLCWGLFLGILGIALGYFSLFLENCLFSYELLHKYS